MTARILKQEGPKVLEWLKASEKHIAVVDRGFRSIIEYLDKVGNIEVKMPVCGDRINKSRQEASSKQAKRQRGKQEVSAANEVLADHTVEGKKV